MRAPPTSPFGSFPPRPARRARRPRWLGSRIRHSALAWWAATFVLAGSALSLVHGVAARGSALAARYGSPRPVVVVDRTIAAGDVVRATDVVRREVPAELVPEGAVTAVPAAAGRVALVDLVRGEVVVRSRLAPGGASGAAALVSAGRRALAIPAGVTGRPPVRVGDRVEVYAGGTVVAADALVVAIDEHDDIVTVAVDEADAPALAAALATTTVTLALTSPGDTAPGDTAPGDGTGDG